MPTMPSFDESEDDASDDTKSKNSLDIDGKIHRAKEGLAKSSKEAFAAEKKLSEENRKKNDDKAEATAKAAFTFGASSSKKEGTAPSSSTLTPPKNPREQLPRKFQKHSDIENMKNNGKALRNEAKASASMSKKKKKQLERRNKLSGFYATSTKAPGGGECENNGNKSRKVTVEEPFIGPINPEPDL